MSRRQGSFCLDHPPPVLLAKRLGSWRHSGSVLFVCVLFVCVLLALPFCAPAQCCALRLDGPLSVSTVTPERGLLASGSTSDTRCSSVPLASSSYGRYASERARAS